MSNPAGIGIAPASFWDWFTRVYNPNDFVYNWQHYLVSITATNAVKTAGNLNIQVPLYAFAFRSHAWVSSSGAKPGFPYGIGIALLSGNDWTFGQWSSETITGDCPLSTTHYDAPFAWPREVPASTQLTVTIDNTLYASSTTLVVHAGIVGIEPRRREQSVGKIR